MKKGFIITIGSFDGVHRGHASLLSRARLEARKRNLKSMALTFRIPPKMVLDPHISHEMLSTPWEKEVLIKAFKIDRVLFLDFDRKIAGQKSFYFFRHQLVGEFNARGIVVGSNFRFGINRSAGALELVHWGEEFGIPVWVIAPVKEKEFFISSSKIRDLIKEGRFETAHRFLGHPYLISGPKVKGRGGGKKLGFPTINLEVKKKALPRGVFVVSGWSGSRPLTFPFKKRFYGVCNIGTRPTFLKHSPVIVEVHVLKDLKNARGKFVFVELLKKLRNEKKFSSKETLISAIARDVGKARLEIKKHIVKSI